MPTDNINHPSHYNQLKVEVIDVVRHLPFNAGNVIKYIMRAPFKGSQEDDLKKALWYAHDILDHYDPKKCFKISHRKFRRLFESVAYYRDTVITSNKIPHAASYARLIEMAFISSVIVKGSEWTNHSSKKQYQELKDSFKHSLQDALDMIEERYKS